MSLRRHALVRVSPADWPVMLGTAPHRSSLPPLARDLLEGWAGRGWPAIVRRRSTEDPPGALPLGVPLPPAAGKQRIGLALPAGTAWTEALFPDLASARASAPASWQAPIDALLRLGQDCAASPRPFGALLWQAVTGLAYLRPGSDLDLLWPVTPDTDLDRLLDGLARIDAAGGLGLDGELLFQGGAGVHWRELARVRQDPVGEVLAKSVDGLALRRASSLRPAGEPSRRSFP